MPALTPLLKQIEQDHQRLHQSAADMGKVFSPGDRELTGFLAAREADHLRWATSVAQRPAQPVRPAWMWSAIPPSAP